MIKIHRWVFLGQLIFCSSLSFSAESLISDSLRDSLLRRYPKIPVRALEKAENFYREHASYFRNTRFLTIVNFDQPSTEERLYLIQTGTGKVATMLVAHGGGSADEKDKSRAVSFSNLWNSFQSPLGVFRTLDKNAVVTIRNPNGEYESTGFYQGKYGWSLRLQGLEPTNSQTLNREIVIHGYRPASWEYIHDNGYLGLTAGCPAVEVSKVGDLVDRIAGQSLYLIYHSSLSY